MNDPNLQPLIEALAGIVGFWLWPWMIAISWGVLLIGRATFIKWMEALGWNGIVALFANIRDTLRGTPVQPQVQVVRELRVSDNGQGVMVPTMAERPIDETTILPLGGGSGRGR